MKAETVSYHFQFDEREVRFEVETQPRLVKDDETTYPDWARLGANQCACCPLKESDCTYCPVAMRINEVMEAFSNNQSIERVEVTVKTAERTYSEACDLQVGINSLIGLLMATSECPHLKELGSMASFHIPFCSTRETLQRTVSSYLIKQYFKQLDGQTPDWELHHLKALYDTLEGLNRDFSRRVQGSALNDAISNAVIMFFATSVVVSSSLEQQLKRHQSYLTNSAD
jgi:hypothetical protein